jgi:hypothetical protein
MKDFAPEVWARDPPPAELTDSDDSGYAALVDAISRGSGPAFAELFDRTSAEVRAVLAALPVGTGRRQEILAASYLEVWWLAGCHTGPVPDVVEWITGIARRKFAEAHAGGEPSSEPVGAGRTAPAGYALRELAALLRRPVAGLVPE